MREDLEDIKWRLQIESKEVDFHNRKLAALDTERQEIEAIRDHAASRRDAVQRAIDVIGNTN